MMIGIVFIGKYVIGGGSERVEGVWFGKEIEDGADEMRGLVGYYFHFFDGMYGFMEGGYMEGI
ncbi:hypothetical protein [Bacillus sp. WP8]|uniref:hypothetical protein n=1 Tax=Bacillus sp. WP8 TaxID=756828 RepID=UPI0011A8DEF2|nr:hypothetical protein [Bacillus sp. WP8]